MRLFVNGRLHTQDDTLPLAEALAIDGARIVEVGATDEILWLGAGATEVVDLQGRTVVPGFVDPHNHFSLGAHETFWADCRGARSVSEIQQRLTDAAARTPDGEWVRGFGYDHAALGGHPGRHDLDDAAPGRPVVLLHYSHHQAVASTRALAAAGITRATRDPAGGEIARDKSGEPTGLLFERAMSEIEARSRAGAETRFVAVAREATLRYASLGLTAIQDAAVTPAMARRYEEARAAGALAIDIGAIMVGSRGWFERPDDAAPGPLKVFVDGGYRCALRLARGGVPRSSGFLFYERPELTALLGDAWRAGRCVVVHAIGNVGVETAVGAIEDAIRDMPDGRGMVRLDHAIFLTRELIDRLADLGIWVVVQPSFLWDGGGTSPDPDVMLRPFASALRAGVRQAFSSDFPCGCNAPLAGIAAAVTRRSRMGQLAQPEEAISPADALRAYTLDAARAAGLGEVTGSLTPGKRADLLVLSADPLGCPPEEIAAIRVLETWSAGRRLINAP